ncbi:MAG TPA: UDP-glucose 4-epimerase GalE [Ktedonobacterales bacterium]|nr:UDP-glucose 4-epimerase GalE [Ktedonobacterales bacterium]
MQVLVTGGAGYIGSVIVEELLAAGHSVVVYDSLVKGHLDAVHPEATFVHAQLAERDHLRHTLEAHQIEAIIHMAAFSLVPESVAHPERYFENNVSGSLAVVQAMIDAGVKRLVFSSTAALFGEQEQMPISEEARTQPTNPYGASKLLVEQMLPWIAQAHGMTCTSLRYFNAAGATERYGEDHHPETHLIPLVLTAAQQGQPVTVMGTDYTTPDGSAVRDYIHVVDLAQAHIQALKSAEPGLSAYNLGIGHGYSVRQVIESARKVTGLAIKVEEGPRRAGDQAITIASAERIRAALGWQPRYPDLDTIIESAWQWKQKYPNGYAK